MRKRLAWAAYSSLRPGVIAILVALFLVFFGLAYLAGQRDHSQALLMAFISIPLLIQAAVFLGIRYNDGFRAKAAQPEKALQDSSLHFAIGLLSALAGIGLLIGSVVSG